MSSQKLIIKNNAASPCTPVCLAVSCDPDNKMNYAVNLPAQKILYNRSGSEAVSDFVVTLDLPFYLGCQLLEPQWQDGALAPLNVRFTDILDDGTEGASVSASFTPTLTANPYGVAISLVSESGVVPLEGFVGCRFVACLEDDIKLTVLNGFALCDPIEKSCSEACGKSSICSTLAPEIVSSESATTDIFDLSISAFDLTGASFAWTTDVGAFIPPSADVNPIQLDLTGVAPATTANYSVVITWPNGTSFTLSGSVTRS